MNRYAAPILLLLLGCSNPTSIPSLGSRYKLSRSDKSLMVGSSQIWPYEEAMFDGIKFQVAVNDRGKVAYLATQDPAFKTPEGISSNSTLEDVLKAGANPPIDERGWAFHTVLPSGWSVAFGILESKDGNLVESGPPISSTKVAWLFKRR